MKIPLTNVRKLTKVIAALAWAPLAVALAVLSYGGIVAIGQPVTVAWLLAIGITLASSAFAGLARATGHILYGVLAVVAIAFLAAFDYCNIANELRGLHQAPALVAAAVAEAEGAQVSAVRAQVTSLEERLRAMRSQAESERLGLKSGKPGEGPAYRLLVAQTEALEAELHSKRAAEAQAVLVLSGANRKTAEVTAEMHLLAGVSPWVLFVGAVILELVVAGLAWGMGEGAACRQPTPQVIVQNIGRPSPDTVDENEPLSTNLRRRAARVEQRCRRAGY